MKREELIKKIDELESQLKPLKKQLTDIYISDANSIEDKIKRCNRMEDKFNPDELLFAAYARCSCGYGLAYPLNIGIHGAWYCSSILLGTAEKGSTHDSALPFAFYEIKSENQPSAQGATTRPKVELIK